MDRSLHRCLLNGRVLDQSTQEVLGFVVITLSAETRRLREQGFLLLRLLARRFSIAGQDALEML